MHKAHPLRIFWFSGLLTLILAGVVGYYDGLLGLWLFAILIVLEVTLSFDNAVVNSKVLATMSRFWQTIFLTVGIFIAVFVVRFLLPIVIVQVASGLGFMEVVDLALNDAEQYGHVLHEAAPMIDAFGGDDSFQPELGDLFDVVHADTILDQGLVFDFPTLPGLRFAHEIIDIGSGQALRLSVMVPEPATLPLLALGMLMAWRRRSSIPV